MLEFLHYQDGAWIVEEPVPGPPDKVCAQLKTFSPMALAFKNLKPTFNQETVEPKTYFTGRAVKNEKLPEATGGDPPLRYTLELAPLAGLMHDPPATGARHGGTITGTPTKPTARQEYTLTATDKNGDKATLPFTIEVKPDIQNRDLALVLAGVGRTLASDAVEILGGRFGSSPASRLQVTLGGQVLRLTNPPASPSPSYPPPSPLSSSPSPLAGEGRGEGGVLRGEGGVLRGEGEVLRGEGKVLQGEGSLLQSEDQGASTRPARVPQPLATSHRPGPQRGPRPRRHHQHPFAAFPLSPCGRGPG